MSAIEIKISTSDFVTKQLKKAESELAKKVDSAITKAAYLVHATAVKGIQRGKKTGRTYTSRSIKHTASALGEYPASDTGRFVDSIPMEKGFFEEDVGSDLKYVGYL